MEEVCKLSCNCNEVIKLKLTHHDSCPHLASISNGNIFHFLFEFSPHHRSVQCVQNDDDMKFEVYV